jgi:hydroxyacylglutathione hydrolase
MLVEVLHALADNFIFLVEGQGTGDVIVVDPADARPVLDWCARHGRRAGAILNTHHHRDHTAGNGTLAAAFPGIPVYAGARDRSRTPGATHFGAGGDEILVCGRAAKVIDVPGHTLGHVAYFFPEAGGGELFSGDTVFGCTIGNLFEGTADDMFGSMQRLRALPPATRLWCAHENTLQYVADAAHADPGNATLAARLRRVEEQIARGEPTVPLALADELATNPFFRWDDPALQRRLGTRDPQETFRRLCED